MHRMIAQFSLLMLLVGPAAAAPAPAVQAAPADPWLARTTSVQFQPQRAPDAPLQMDVPKKDWMVLPSSGCVLMAMANRRGDAVVLVERSTLAVALDPATITDVFAEIEIATIKERHPKAADFQSKIIDAGARRLVAVQYVRPGVLGSERVRQYSMPMGKQLYHLTVISGAAQFGAYEPVFSHIAASFSITE